MLINNILNGLNKSRLKELLEDLDVDFERSAKKEVLIDHLVLESNESILEQFINEELKEILREQNLPVSGKKSDKIKRILEQIRNEDSEPVIRTKVAPDFGVWANYRTQAYDYCYAIAELIDNSIQSNRDGGGNLKDLVITIEFDGTTRIIVQDNAFGFSAKDFDRAFSPAARPKKRRDLNEFGQGMKAACTWMADKWIVSTRTPNSPVQRSVEVDVANLLKEPKDFIPVQTQAASGEGHGTTITLSRLRHKLPTGMAQSTTKKRLAEMYKIFLEKGVKIIFKSISKTEILQAQPHPKPLKAQPVQSNHLPIPDSKTVEWIRDEKKYIYKVGTKELEVRVEIRIREKSYTQGTCVRIYRRGRLIEGTDRLPLTPRELVGPGNGFPRQRLYIILHLDNFDVSPLKNHIGFEIGEVEEDEDFNRDDGRLFFFEWLKKRLKRLKSNGVDFWQQAQNYRNRLQKTASESDTDSGPESDTESTSETDSEPNSDTESTSETDSPHIDPTEESSEGFAETESEYSIDGSRIRVQYVEEPQQSDRLWWPSKSKEDDIALLVQINIANPLFKNLPSSARQDFISLLTSLGYAEFKAETGNASEMRYKTEEYLSEITKKENS